MQHEADAMHRHALGVPQGSTSILHSNLAVSPRLPFPSRLLTLIALNPWHGLGLVEAWEARLLMLARLLCCHVGVLTQQQAHLPDK